MQLQPLQRDDCHGVVDLAGFDQAHGLFDVEHYDFDVFMLVC